MDGLIFRIKRVLPFAVAGIFLILAGCSAGSWGKLTHSEQLMEEYRDKRLAKNDTYYYCGRSSLPYAVVGIDSGYTFESRFWFKIESLDEVYRKINNLSDLEAFHTILYAKDILSPSGAVIGTWFSYYNNTVISVDAENKIVTVFNPYKPGSRVIHGG